MEVLCDRCQTEYEFDDALVSERGTTVKCTNCGHQFRIFRPKTLSSPPERWEVRRGDGRDLVFTSLRDLQRAITRGQVGRWDMLTRGGLPSRKLSEIAELEPFFPEDAPTTVSRNGSERPRVHTPQGLGPWDSRPPIPSIHREADDEDFDEATIPRVSAGTDRNLPPAHDLLGEEPGFEPALQRHPGESPSQGRSKSERPEEALQAPNKVEIRQSHAQLMTPTPSDVRASYARMDEAVTDPRFLSAPPPKPSAAARWVIAVVVLGALGVVGATVGRSYLADASGPSTSATAPDERVAGWLEEGERQLKEGDIEAAKANFDKASVLADSDVHVLRAMARWTNIKADQAWLKLRLLPPDQVDVVRITQSELDARAKQAIAASRRVWEASSGDPVSARVWMDSLRLSGDLSQARSLVPNVADHKAEPEHAYVLAALEMGEKSPNWTLVVDRLRVAVAEEHQLGRARAALIYALLRSGKVNEAKTELQALERLPRSHPLIIELKAFFDRMETRVADGGKPSVGPDADALDPAQLPPVTAGRTSPRDDTPGAEVTAGSYQDLLKRAHAARQRGDWDAAERLYRAALAQNPGDTEALAGLGDVAKARGDKSGSIEYYEKVKEQNPGYVPALIGLADAKWDAGDRAGAVALYQQILSATSGQGPYATRARQRVAEAAKSSSEPKPDSTPPSEPTATPPASTDTAEPPGETP